ncbi:MAG: S24/S26 family peptidase [Bacilli bacterium]
MKIVKKIVAFIPALLFVLGLTLIIYVGYSAYKGKYPKILGYSFMVVVTDSMEPIYNIGDFIAVRTQPEYIEGDVVTFYFDLNGDLKDELVSHKIADIDGNVYTMVGVNPDYEGQSQTIEKDDILGKVVWKSTILGGLFSTNLLQNKQVIFAIITIVLVIFIIYQAIHMIKIAKNKETE